MAVAGITKRSSFKPRVTDSHLRNVKFVYRSPDDLDESLVNSLVLRKENGSRWNYLAVFFQTSCNRFALAECEIRKLQCGRLGRVDRKFTRISKRKTAVAGIT